MKHNQEYTVRLAEDGDHQLWDDYAAAHPAASPYHLFAWKNAVEEAYGHKGYYVMALDSAQDVAGVLPLIHLRLPVLLNELTALPFCDVGGVLCDNAAVSDLLLGEAFSLSGRIKAQKIHLRGNTAIPEGFLNRLHREENNKVRMFLTLPESSESLFNGFTTKLRTHIRRAEKNGLSFRWGTAGDIDDYYSVFSQNMRDLGSPVHSKQWFRSILKHYGSNARMGLIALQQRIIGCGIILSIGHTFSIPWASSIRKHNRLGTNMLLYWNILKYVCDAGATTFDFGRSSAGEGTYTFKKQWGAAPSPLDWYSNRSADGASVSIAHAGSGNKERLADIWKKFPMPFANFVGPRLRKYISL